MKNVLQSLIFFPMPLIWFMLIIILIGSKQKIIFFFKFVFAILFLISLPLLNTIIEYPLKNSVNSYSNTENISFVLVPTAGIYRDSSNKWHASKETILRVSDGQKVAKKFKVPLVISGGKIPKDAPAEAYVARKYLVTSNLIILDQDSKNSFETAKNLKKIILNNNLDNEVVVISTSILHNLRMSLALKTRGFVVRNSTKNISQKLIFSELIPHTSSFGRFNSSLYEYLAIIKYILFGYIDFKTIIS